jgi:hypothetical protein
MFLRGYKYPYALGMGLEIHGLTFNYKESEIERTASHTHVFTQTLAG